MRLWLSIAVGVLAPFVFIAGASPFEIPGQNSLREILAGSVAVVVYSAICEFFIARGHTRTARERWTLALTTVVALLAVSVLLALQGGYAWLFGSVPIFASGCVGIAAAVALLARHDAARMSHAV